MLQIRKFKKTCIYNITYAKNNLFSDIMEPVTKFIRETGIQYILALICYGEVRAKYWKICFLGTKDLGKQLGFLNVFSIIKTLNFVGPNFHFHIIFLQSIFLYCYTDQNMSCSLGKLIPTAYKNLVYCFKPRRHWINTAQSAGRHSHE